ncbi:MAG: NAD-dependent epimerase/dehydratase family protein [Flavobacteriales bacterium]
MNFITGGTGLLGAHLLFHLVSKGEPVRALKRSGSSLKTAQDIFEFYSSDKTLFSKIEWVDGDVLDILSLEDAMQGCDYVYHCAATVSFAKRDKEQMFKINIEGTHNVVNMALKLNIKKLCHVSSTAALGDSIENGKITEEKLWVDKEGKSNYAFSKKYSEMEVWRGIEDGLNAVIVNPSVIIGPGNEEKSSASLFNKVKKGLKFYTHGVNGFVDARDVVEIMVRLMKSDIQSERFLAISENISFKELFDAIALNLKLSAPSREAKRWMAEIIWRVDALRCFLFRAQPFITKENAQSAYRKAYYSNEKVRERLGFEYRSIKESVKDAARFYM